MPRTLAWPGSETGQASIADPVCQIATEIDMAWRFRDAMPGLLSPG